MRIRRNKRRSPSRHDSRLHAITQRSRTNPLSIERLEDRHLLATFPVTSLADSGAGTLRQAISNANSTPGADTITFSVAGTINVLSTLPALADTTAGTTIDGTAAPGFAGTPVVVLKGPGSSSSIAGLRLWSAANDVRGLQINAFSRGVQIAGPSASGNTIAGNYIGTDGTIAFPNAIGVEIIGASSNFIGSNGDGINDVSERNVISGNTQDGVLIHTGFNFDGAPPNIDSAPADRNALSGNYIGVNASSSSSIGNGRNGIKLVSANNTRVGTNGNGAGYGISERNVISGNASNGIEVSGGSGIVVAGNFIGTDATGLNAKPNGTGTGSSLAGISLSGTDIRIGSDGNGIADDFEGNIISGNRGRGVLINFGSNIVIAGNLIGTNHQGTAAVPNTRDGIGIFAGSGIRIGTNGDGLNDAAERNLISGNLSWAINDSGGDQVAGTIVAGNYVGTDITGTSSLPNSFGVSLLGNGNRIGTDGNGLADDAERNVIRSRDKTMFFKKYSRGRSYESRWRQRLVCSKHLA